MPPVPWDDTITFEKLVSFCEKNCIPTTGALALTMSRNRTGEYASLIVDMEERKFYDLYPKRFNQVYREGPVSEDQEFLYCYQATIQQRGREVLQDGREAVEHVLQLVFLYSSNL